MDPIPPHSFWTLAATGFGLYFVGVIWLLFAAYREGMSWGRMIPVIPGASLLFAASHPKAVIIPAIFQITGFVLLCLAMNKLWAATPFH